MLPDMPLSGNKVAQMALALAVGNKTEQAYRRRYVRTPPQVNRRTVLHFLTRAKRCLPRSAAIDIAQAVGRLMRKPRGTTTKTVGKASAFAGSSSVVTAVRAGRSTNGTSTPKAGVS
jgi:hypothetical protein